MKLLLTVVTLVAVAHGAPTTTHSMEIGANGISGSIQNIPLVEIIVNLASTPATANEPVIEAQPVLVVDDAQNPEPVTVVDQAQNPTPVIVVDKPVEVNPIDVVAINPEPAPVVVGQPDVNPIDIISVNPEPSPVVVEQPEANPIDIISVNPAPAPVVLPEPTPAEVAPEASPVVPAPTPAEVAEVPAPEATEAAEGNQIINVVMNFIFGASGSLSSVEVPANVIPQLVGAPRV